MLLWTVIGLSERRLSDIVIVAILVLVIVALIVGGRRSRADDTWRAEVHAAYLEPFAGVGCVIADVTPIPIDGDLAKLVVSIERSCDADADNLSAVSATATLCGLNALTRWQTITSFEVELLTNGDPIPVTALQQARHDPSNAPRAGQTTPHRAE